MKIETTKGLIEESLLTKVPFTEEIPCGWSDSTKYILDGEVVREDVNIRVKEGVMSEAFAGSLVPLTVKEFIELEYRAFLQDLSNVIGERIQTRFPELSGLNLTFNLPGFVLNIGPKPEPTKEM